MNGILFMVFLSGLIICTFSQSKVEQSEDGMSGTISFSPPTLSDDEAHSPWVPDGLKCDACRAVSYQLWKGFTTFNRKRPSFNMELPESEIVAITEDVCTDDEAFQEYGMKEVNKLKRIAGPGLETSDVPGVSAGGGKWPVRMMDMCEQYVGMYGEMALYDIYKKDPKSIKKLENYLCRGKGERGICKQFDTYLWEQEKERRREKWEKEDAQEEKEDDDDHEEL